jgi:hypothetical protein
MSLDASKKLPKLAGWEVRSLALCCPFRIADKENGESN